MRLIIHRGTLGDAPENSIKGIQRIHEFVNDALIEIDIAPSKDNVAVLSHDLTLSRLCSIDRLIFDYEFKELNEIQTKYVFCTLEEVLEQFPTQKFLLDVRCNLHPDFFPESNINITEIQIDLQDKIIKSLQNTLKEKHKDVVKIMCSDLVCAKKIKELFPEFKVDLSENYVRNLLPEIQRHEDISVLDFLPDTVHIQNKFFNDKIIDILKKNNINISSTPSLLPSYDNSIEMIKRSLQYRVDSIWLNYINSEIINKYFKDKE